MWHPTHFDPEDVGSILLKHWHPLQGYTSYNPQYNNLCNHFHENLENYRSAYLYKVSSILHVIHNVLHQTFSLLRFEGLLPEKRGLAKVILISRVVPTKNHMMK
jgi:hypothetical protein